MRAGISLAADVYDTRPYLADKLEEQMDRLCGYR